MHNHIFTKLKRPPPDCRATYYEISENICGTSPTFTRIFLIKEPGNEVVCVDRCYLLIRTKSINLNLWLPNKPQWILASLAVFLVYSSLLTVSNDVHLVSPISWKIAADFSCTLIHYMAVNKNYII